jgi:DNA-binding MarR family transcriptional regulator
MPACYCSSLRLAARKVTAAYDEALAPVGVNVAQFAMLRRIERTEPVSLTELGEVCDLERSTVGRNAKVLERMGLVRIGIGEDQREATLSLTVGGRAILKAGAPLWDGAQERIERALGRDDAARLLSLLGSF